MLRISPGQSIGRLEHKVTRVITPAMSQWIRIHPNDNVAVAVGDLPAGSADDGMPTENIGRGHKFALLMIAAGQPVIKYGFPIGVAATDIAAGQWVHQHNLKSNLAEDWRNTPCGFGKNVQADSREPILFDGYQRPDGSVGVRNDLWIIPTVGCVNQAAQQLAQQANARWAGREIDAAAALIHPYGCSQLGDDLKNTQAILAGLIRHPNAAGVLVLGLGCENNQWDQLKQMIEPLDERRVRFLSAQQAGDEIAEGMAILEQLAVAAARQTRRQLPVAHLTVAMKCGGSDGLSGITANPLVGRIALRLAAQGATVLLSEVPEMFGAESVLLGQCNSDATRLSAIAMLEAFRDYFRLHHEPIDENPSPGNKQGGITTLAEKSLGCVQKAGGAPIGQVLAYGQPAKRQLGGVALVNAPGNDAVSSTAMVAAGAQIVLFTTGRGTPLGLPVPTIKISSNSDLAKRKSGWIDFDAGPLAEGHSMDELAQRLLQLLVQVAEGKPTRNEENHTREIAIWKEGVTL